MKVRKNCGNLTKVPVENFEKHMNFNIFICNNRRPQQFFLFESCELSHLFKHT